MTRYREGLQDLDQVLSRKLSGSTAALDELRQTNLLHSVSFLLREV